MKYDLRKKLPDILLESLFILVALLGALALDEWREDKQKHEQGVRAKVAIVEELSQNRKQLESRLDKNKAVLEQLEQEIKKTEASGSETKPSLNFNYQMALLSDAAWDSAKMTQSAQFMSLEDVSLYAQVYRFQSVFLNNQNKLIDKVMEIGELKDGEFLRFLKGYTFRLNLLIEINEKLIKAYDEAITKSKQ